MASHQEESELGFREAPNQGSVSAVSYMARIVELWSFIGAFYRIIGAVQSIKVPPNLAERAERGEFKFYDFSEHVQLVNEIQLVRAVESFDLYLLSILREIFESQPNMLKSEAAIDAATVIDLGGNLREIVRHIAEKRLHELAYLPLSALQKFVKDRTSIEIFATREVYECAVLASEVRNLIAHNDCRTNKQFENRTKGISNPLRIAANGKVVIDDRWLRKASYALDGAVFDIDAAAVEKYSLAKLPSRELVTLRRVHSP